METSSTTHNRHTKASRGGWYAAIFIIVVEIAERFAYYGVAGNLITYLTTELGQSISAAAKNVNNWIGVSALFPVLGAIIADSYLGRFRTIIFSTTVYLMGTILLILSVSVVPPASRKAVFFTALYILSVGEGGHKPCVQTFAADQFNEELPEEKKAKSSFFNWWYAAIVFAATAATLAIVYIQDNVGWALSFGIVAGVLAAALVVFLIGWKRYKMQRAAGSPFTKVARVFVAAVKKRRVKEDSSGWGVCDHDDESSQRCDRGLARTNQFRFLDKAMIIDEEDLSNKTRNPWRLCTQNEVEEVKLIVRLIPIWLTCLMFTTVQAQLHTFFIKQGSTMVRSIGPHFILPPASLQALTGLIILFFLPIYDQIFIPIARTITGHPSGVTMLQRIGIGQALSILNMVVSALVEAKRVSVATHHGLIDAPKVTVPMGIWWLLPQYMVCGISDVFAIVGLQELFYDQMPEALRSIGAAAHLSLIGIGSFMSTAVILIVERISDRYGDKWLGNNLNRAHLDYFYWVVAGLCALNLCAYVLVAKGFVYKKVEPSEKKEIDMDREI